VGFFMEPQIHADRRRWLTTKGTKKHEGFIFTLRALRGEKNHKTKCRFLWFTLWKGFKKEWNEKADWIFVWL